MRFSPVCLRFALFVLTVFTTQQSRCAIADDQPAVVKTANVDAAWRRRIDKAQEQKVTIDFQDVKLSDAVAFLAEKAKLPIVIDRRALEDVGLDSEVPITISASKISMRSALRLVLSQLELTTIPRDGVLLITTPEEAESALLSEVINVHDLVHLGSDDSEVASADYDNLIALVTSTIAPESWDEVGGPGSIVGYQDALVISQTRDVLRQASDLLRAIRTTIATANEHRDRPPTTTSVRLNHDQTADNAIDLALQQPFDYDFAETPLADVAEFLSEVANINVVLDRPAINDIGIDGDAPVTFEAKQVQLRFALKHLLRELDLTYMIRDEVLLITTSEVCECTLETRLYPASDLLVPAQSSELFPEDDSSCNLDCLVDLIVTTIQPDSWDLVGGPGAAMSFPGGDMLVISQAPVVHDEIETLLVKLRSHMRKVRAPRSTDEQQESRHANLPRLIIYHVPSQQSMRGKSRSKQRAGDNQVSTSSVIPPSSDGRSAVMAQFGFPAEQPNVFGGTAETVIPEDQLLELIKELAAPDQWQAKQIYAKAVPGRLLIRQTPKVHRQVQQLLTHLGVGYHQSPSGTFASCCGHQCFGTSLGGGFGGGGGGFGGGGGGFGGGSGGFFSVPAEKK